MIKYRIQMNDVNNLNIDQKIKNYRLKYTNYCVHVKFNFLLNKLSFKFNLFNILFIFGYPFSNLSYDIYHF